MFDLVCHDILLENLIDLGFFSCLVSWVKEILLGRQMSVSFTGKLRCPEGSRRGSTGVSMDSLLFLIYVEFITSNFLGSLVAFSDEFKLGILSKD